MVNCRAELKDMILMWKKRKKKADKWSKYLVSINYDNTSKSCIEMMTDSSIYVNYTHLWEKYYLHGNKKVYHFCQGELNTWRNWTNHKQQETFHPLIKKSVNYYPTIPFLNTLCVHHEECFRVACNGGCQSVTN